jgi:hypothetical protein
MCLIIEVPKNQSPKRWIVESALEYNADGVGIMHDGKAVKWIKPSVDKIMAYLEEVKPVDAAIHFRMATDGKINKANAHPFKLKNQSWLMHNGILGKYRTTKTAAKSDTRQFVEQFCNVQISQHGSVPKAALEAEIVGNAILIMLKDGSITKYGSGWNKFEGCYYSNEYAWDSPTYASKYAVKSKVQYASRTAYPAYIADDYAPVRCRSGAEMLEEDMLRVCENLVDILPFNDCSYMSYADIELQDELLEEEITAHDFLEFCDAETLLLMYTWAAVNGHVAIA